MLPKLHIVIVIMMSNKETYSSPDLYLSDIENSFFVASESNRLPVLVLCNVHIWSHALNEHQEQITLIREGNSDFTL